MQKCRIRGKISRYTFFSLENLRNVASSSTRNILQIYSTFFLSKNWSTLWIKFNIIPKSCFLLQNNGNIWSNRKDFLCTNFFENNGLWRLLKYVLLPYIRNKKKFCPLTGSNVYTFVYTWLNKSIYLCQKEAINNF